MAPNRMCADGSWVGWLILTYFCSEKLHIQRLWTTSSTSGERSEWGRQQVWLNKPQHDSMISLRVRKGVCIWLGVVKSDGEEDRGRRVRPVCELVMDQSLCSSLKRTRFWDCFGVLCAQRCPQRPRPAALWRTGLLLCCLTFCACVGEMTLCLVLFDKRWVYDLCWIFACRSPHFCLHRWGVRPRSGWTARLTALLVPSAAELWELFHRVEGRWGSGAQVGVGEEQKRGGAGRQQRHAPSWCCTDRELLSGAAHSAAEPAQNHVQPVRHFKRESEWCAVHRVPQGRRSVPKISSSHVLKETHVHSQVHNFILGKFSHAVQCCSFMFPVCLTCSCLPEPLPEYLLSSDWSAHTCLSQHH